MTFTVKMSDGIVESGVLISIRSVLLLGRFVALLGALMRKKARLGAMLL